MARWTLVFERKTMGRCRELLLLVGMAMEMQATRSMNGAKWAMARARARLSVV
jgi:hypothetical protein